MKPTKLRDLSLEQLLDIQGERFAENLQSDRDVDVYSNHVNRHIVRAMGDEKDGAFLGVFYPRIPEMPLFRPWEGEGVPAFSADFVTPTLDKELIQLVEDYTRHRADLDPTRLFAITARLDEIGGVLLHWLREESEENRLRVVND